MEESWKWISGSLGLIIALVGIRLTWILSHKKSHKDIYDKMDKKADKDYVDDQIKKISENVNSKVDDHIRESATVSQMTLQLIQGQNEFLKSIDENVKVVLKKMIE